MTEVRNADPDVVEVLVSAGVSLTEWHLPAELGERPNGAPISHDDLLDFHALLDQDDWMTSLIATDELFRSFDKDEATPERG